MYTENTRPGKFEGNQSRLLAEILDNIVSNGNHSDSIDWYQDIIDCDCLVKGKKHWFIVHYDDYGFISYGMYSPEECKELWEDALTEYNRYY